MDMDQLLIIVLSAAILFAFVNLYRFLRSKQKEEAKRSLRKLYYPLHSILAKKNKCVLSLKNDPRKKFEKFAIEYYRIFLELQNRYLENKMYESSGLARAFDHLMEENGIGAGSENRPHSLPEEVIRNVALFELTYQVDEEGFSQLERNMQALEEVIESDISKLTKRALPR